MICVPGKAFSVKRACPVYFCSTIFERSEIGQCRWVAKQNADAPTNAFSIAPGTATKLTGRRRRSSFDSRYDISPDTRAHADGRCEVSEVPKTASTTAEPTTDTDALQQHASVVAIESPDASDKVIERSGEDANRARKDCLNKTKESGPFEYSKEKEAPGTSSTNVDDATAYQVVGSKQQPNTVDNISFWVHIGRRAREQGSPVRACRLTCVQGERTTLQGGVGSSRKRIVRDERSNKDDVESAEYLSEEEVVVLRPSIKEAGSTSEEQLMELHCHLKTPHQFFYPRCD